MVKGAPAFHNTRQKSAKYALEALDYAVAVRAVLKEFAAGEHLRETGKTDRTALLENGESCNPNGEETVPAEGQTEATLPDDIEKANIPLCRA